VSPAGEKLLDENNKPMGGSNLTLSPRFIQLLQYQTFTFAEWGRYHSGANKFWTGYQPTWAIGRERISLLAFGGNLFTFSAGWHKTRLLTTTETHVHRTSELHERTLAKCCCRCQHVHWSGNIGFAAGLTGSRSAWKAARRFLRRRRPGLVLAVQV